MVNFNTDRLQTIFNSFAGKRIAVVGDLMLDRYFWGTVSRLSPEAPVPVVEVEEESTRLGGAANVANNIASLGSTPLLVGVVGNDSGAELMRSIVKEKGFPTTGLVVDAARPTTMKTRVIAHNQHVVRVDQEIKSDISHEIERNIVDVLTNDISSIDGIILEDYNKGVLTNNLIKEVVHLATTHRKVITVDPKFNNFFDYRDVTVFKPNRKEMEEAIGRKIIRRFCVRGNESTDRCRRFRRRRYGYCDINDGVGCRCIRARSSDAGKLCRRYRVRRSGHCAYR
jgi:rfaE bifunctional protein kinase chain/domain